MFRQDTEHPLNKFKQGIIHSAILDTSILDELISKLVLNTDDREEITDAPSQAERNNVLLDMLIKKPFNTFGLVGKLLEECEKNNEDIQRIVQQMKQLHPTLYEQTIIDHIDMLTHEEGLEGESDSRQKDKARILKNYRNIIENVDCTGTLCDKLVENDVLALEEQESICAQGLTRKESCRRMLAIILRKNCSGFLEALRIDHAYDELVDEIVCTTVTDTDMKLLKFGEYCFQRKDYVLPSNIEDNLQDQIRSWIDDDKLFYSETEAVKAAKQIVKENKIVTIIGAPGAGKTSTARHIALDYYTRGWEVVPLSSHAETKQFGDKKLRQIFVLDDVLGVLSVDMSLFNSLNSYKESIFKAIGMNSKLVCTCRKLVYNEAKKRRCFVIENCIDIDDDVNRLTEDHKQHILHNHCKNANVPIEAYKSISLKESHPMFPLLCRMFSSSEHYQKMGQRFFDYPIDCTIDELDSMNGLHYAVLVLCMLNSRKISRSNKPLSFIDKELTYEVFDTCSDCLNPTNKQIVDALHQLSEIYLQKSGESYTFIHDSVYEIIAYHFGKQNIELMLKFMPSSFICNKIILSEIETANILNIAINEDMYPALAERLYKDIQGGHLYDVFTNSALSETRFVKEFMIYLKNLLSYQQFKKLFLEVMEGNTDHITNQSKEVSKVKEEGDNKYFEEDRQRLLLGCVRSEYSYKYSIRIISFIIYYGHNYLLQSIMTYVLTENDNATDALGSDHTEQSRLLTLGSYSNNPDIMKTLLAFCDKKCINMCSIADGTEIMGNSHRNHTPMSAACHAGNISVVKFLLETGAILNPIDEPHYTPLTAASEGGQYDVLVFLVIHGCQVNLCDKLNRSPLYIGSDWGRYNIVTFLVDYGGNVNLCDNLNKSPLYMAAWRGHFSVVTHLVNHGAEVNLCDIDKQSPLYTTSKGGHLDIVKFLIENKGDVNLCNRFGKSPLYVALEEGHYEIVDYLVDHGGDVNLCDKYKKSPLFAASKGGHIDVVKYLVNKKGNINLCDKYNQSPLYVASLYGHHDVVKFLLEKGAIVNLCDKYNKSPLFVASWRGHYDVVTCLINHGAEINCCDVDKQSPTYIAFTNGHDDIGNFLVEHGGDANLD